MRTRAFMDFEKKQTVTIEPGDRSVAG